MRGQGTVGGMIYENGRYKVTRLPPERMPTGLTLDEMLAHQPTSAFRPYGRKDKWQLLYNNGTEWVLIRTFSVLNFAVNKMNIRAANEKASQREENG